MLGYIKWVAGLALVGGGIFAFLHFKKGKAGAPQLPAAGSSDAMAQKKIAMRMTAAAQNDKAKGLPAPPQGWELFAQQLAVIAAGGSKSAITSNAQALVKTYPASAAMLAHHAITAKLP